MLRTCAVRLLAIELTLSVEILPGAGNTAHICLAAKLPFRADFARHARHFRGEGVELIDHRIDGLLQLEDFAASRSR